jgi:hypothetical protein
MMPRLGCGIRSLGSGLAFQPESAPGDGRESAPGDGRAGGNPAEPGCEVRILPVALGFPIFPSL